MATFQVPVWFNIEADDHIDAGESIITALNQASLIIEETEPRIRDWVVEEPVHIHTEEN